ncbi:MBL fold metallo-hydrolase [Amycolatopsis viridis]|uniref:Glyoxylase-like metal-dependent hydrolase (Beta-lactamase superfamily II) n=1 Tax=Amycolatopsis viridis TaxID=185678 RepID=A0ABX0SQZ6_9PSEU|nr:MBL fold metallo-hydrolase [Amycolatopsis viridis]NIH78352.1 glyoxylase-like metal-dependent hydrolase (beta-lactamase superfamily II) [Amycolatopsis viridis]
MKIHHLNCGTMRPLGGRLIDGRGGFWHRAELVCHCLLVETGNELVLIETGLGSPAVTRADEWLGARFVRMVGVRTSVTETAAEQVRRLGYALADLRHIVLTHLDLDHAGGLVDFPHATVHVHAEELRALRSPRNARERSRYRPQHFAHGPQWSSYPDAGEKWFGFDAVRQLDGLPPEILLVPLGGHTRGHTGVAVDTGEGWLLHAGDAFFHHGQIDPVRPHVTPGLAWFESKVETVPGARRGNHQRLRELVRDHGDEVSVLSAHDPWFLDNVASGR